MIAKKSKEQKIGEYLCKVNDLLLKICELSGKEIVLKANSEYVEFEMKETNNNVVETEEKSEKIEENTLAGWSKIINP